MENIGQFNKGCSLMTAVQGCANSVPYLMIVSEGCCDSEIKYVNLNTGVTSTTRPAGFTVGECAGASGSVVTIANTVTGHKIADVTINGVTTAINEVITTLTNIKATGNIIGTYNNESGAAVNIRETITTIQVNADGSFTYINENGTSTTIPVSPCKSYFETETFTATAGQSSFTLLTAAQGDVSFTRNGVKLSDNAATVSGQTVTYVPSANNNETLLAGDRIEISYVYTICTGTGTVVDGSETKIVAGTNTTVTGTGTVSNPYVINANVTGLGNFATMNSSGGQAVTSGTVLDWTGTVQTYGTLVVPDLTNNVLLLKAGYIYEVDTEIQMQFANSGAFFNYSLYSGTTAASQTTAIGTPGKVRPNTDTFGNGMYDIPAQAFVVANTDTYVSVKGTNGSGTTTGYEGANFLKAKVIGKI